MFKIAIVVFRECLEISLLLGVILAATRTIDKSKLYIILGSMIGVVFASIFAFFAQNIINSFEGLGDEIFNSCIILLTAAIISWTVVWMQGYTTKIKQDLNKLSESINQGNSSKLILSLVVSAAIFREGSEIILFVYSIASAGKMNIHECVLGFMIGCLSGLVTGSILYMGLIKYAGKYIFKISSIMLTLIAAGLASEAAGIFTSVGVIESLSDQLWDTSWLISNETFIGKILNIIIGYDSKPNGMQIIFYFSTIFITMLMIKIRSLKDKITQ